MKLCLFFALHFQCKSSIVTSGFNAFEGFSKEEVTKKRVKEIFVNQLFCAEE